MNRISLPADIVVTEKTLLSDNWYHLYRYRFTYTPPSGGRITQTREVYDRGNGASVLLYNSKKNTVILVRQMRFPTWLNGNEDGYLLEAIAGLLDEDDPALCASRESVEETGYQPINLLRVCSVYVSPGAVTEILHCYVAEYDDSLRTGTGGGIDDENIEVLEIDFTDAWNMLLRGEIRDAKTVILLQHLKLSGKMQ